MTNTFVVSAGGNKIQRVIAEEGEPRGFEKLTVSSTAVGLASIPVDANSALVQVEDDTIRWKDDGGTPTATDGITVYPSNFINLSTRTRINNFKAIRVTGDAKLQVLYYKR